jgi:hypothetical protein
MPTAAELAWMIAVGLFGALSGITAHLAKRDREEIAKKLDALETRMEKIEKELLHHVIVQERRLTRLEMSVGMHNDGLSGLS